jgi:hypothetical protein
VLVKDILDAEQQLQVRERKACCASFAAAAVLPLFCSFTCLTRQSSLCAPRTHA